MDHRTIWSTAKMARLKNKEKKSRIIQGCCCWSSVFVVTSMLLFIPLGDHVLGQLFEEGKGLFSRLQHIEELDKNLCGFVSLFHIHGVRMFRADLHTKSNSCKIIISSSRTLCGSFHWFRIVSILWGNVQGRFRLWVMTRRFGSVSRSWVRTTPWVCRFDFVSISKSNFFIWKGAKAMGRIGFSSDLMSIGEPVAIGLGFFVVDVSGSIVSCVIDGSVFKVGILGFVLGWSCFRWSRTLFVCKRKGFAGLPSLEDALAESLFSFWSQVPVDFDGDIIVWIIGLGDAIGSLGRGVNHWGVNIEGSVS